MTQTVLLSFNGAQDPFNKSGNDGPILNLLRHRPAEFQKVFLLHNHQLKREAAVTAAEIRKRHPNLQTVLPCELAISDPTDYGQILEALRRTLLEIYDRDARYTVSLSSGTPQMHACWFFLVASSEIRAEVIHVRENRFAKKDLVTKIDPTKAAFPTVRFRQDSPAPTAVNQDEIDAARQQAGIVGQDPTLIEVMEKAAMAAPTDYPVLLLGPSGSGKELFARFIHLMSRRKNETFIGLDCGAIPDSLIESELFGHRKGVFTSADRDKTGAFVQADRGTLFLDEIGNMSHKSQAALLRTLQTGRVRPLGAQSSSDEATVDIRVI
ncbi:MAG: RNA repair transcriptional activator RtcR family protein, partial [Desulfococcaceae bacterium]